MSNKKNIDDYKFPEAWGTPSEKLREATKTAMAQRQSKHGLYAHIPLICRGDKCPYKESCMMYQMDVHSVGDPCADEIALIELTFDELCKELDLKENSAVDAGQVRDYILQLVMQERAHKVMSRDGDIIMDQVVGMSDAGDPIYRKEEHIALSTLDKAIRIKSKIMDELMATRKAKAGDTLNVKLDPSSYATQINRKKRELEKKNKVKDGTPEIDGVDK